MIEVIIDSSNRFNDNKTVITLMISHVVTIYKRDHKCEIVTDEPRTYFVENSYEEVIDKIKDFLYYNNKSFMY